MSKHTLAALQAVAMGAPSGVAAGPFGSPVGRVPPPPVGLPPHPIGNQLGRDGRTVDEEQPTMRSVAMGAPSGVAAGPFGSPVGRVPPPPVGLPPLRGFSGLEKSEAPSPLKVEREMRSRVQKHREAYRTWQVSSVESFPDDFPLERTSRHIPDADAPVVSARISDCLRERSIEAKYDDVKATAKCRTPDYVSFKIRLFGGREDVEGGGIIVEVQRRKGSSHCFMRDCRAVLTAAEGDKTEEEETTIFLKRPVSEMTCLKGVQVSDDESDEVMKAPASLMSSDKYDSHMLGMESVEKLTNPLYSAPEVVVLAAKSVVLPEDSSDIRDSVSKLLQHGCLRSDDAPMTGPEGDNDFNEEMHHLALSVVLNAVRSTAKDGTLAEAIVQQREWFSQVLIPVLINDIKAAGDQGHHAVKAVECLISLTKFSSAAKAMIVESGAVEALEQSRGFASDKFASLCSDLEGELGLLSHQ
eukprot:CAMPEP_0197464462 /NCGR_PEP_ID=MMETSP1175-20131217/64032_1 /TAXON_ID=1003142 /ORGANISM="Triceratium dubium, Strain CCMP147" /LENGTH=469 /DNA_ID=CAMNT_0043000443 /DNA_START=409 /DNA_END=1819 /DNA_ORIENTATION=+